MSLPDWLFAGVILDDESPPRTILIASDTAEIVFEGEPHQLRQTLRPSSSALCRAVARMADRFQP